MHYEDELREALGIDAETLGDYRPADAVEKIGRSWGYRSVRGEVTAATYPTRREAVEAARQHKGLLADQYAHPGRYMDIVRVRASKRLRLIERYMAEGMTEMKAGAKAYAEVPDPQRSG